MSPPGEYPSPSRAVLVKTAGPAVSREQLGKIDIGLCSHHQHPDNLDPAGRELLLSLPRAFSAPAAAASLGDPVQGMREMEEVEIPRPGGGTITITAVPAQHGPEGAEAQAGPVTGFVLSVDTDDEPLLYISGDNASVPVARKIGHTCGPIDAALLFCGRASTTLLNGAPLTLSAAQAVAVAQALQVHMAIGLHISDWRHINEGPAVLRDAFDAFDMSTILAIPPRGQWMDLPSGWAAGRR